MLLLLHAHPPLAVHPSEPSTPSPYRERLVTRREPSVCCRETATGKSLLAASLPDPAGHYPNPSFARIRSHILQSQIPSTRHAAAAAAAALGSEIKGRLRQILLPPLHTYIHPPCSSATRAHRTLARNESNRRPGRGGPLLLRPYAWRRGQACATCGLSDLSIREHKHFTALCPPPQEAALQQAGHRRCAPLTEVLLDLDLLL